MAGRADSRSRPPRSDYVIPLRGELELDKQLRIRVSSPEADVGTITGCPPAPGLIFITAGARVTMTVRSLTTPDFLSRDG
jgi:hypothetical protein